MEINGVAHLQLCVRDLAACREFYHQVLRFMGLRPFLDTDGFLYYIGGRTAVAVTQCPDEFRNEPFVQGRAGLHHVCFRARSREDIDALHEHLRQMGARIVHPPEEGAWAPGYYSVLFEDPEGIRIEVNHVPGKGVLEPSRDQPR
jgi:catechol 2,3-dioxygenase-like lactoylglutathione lyase family enzyme